MEKQNESSFPNCVAIEGSGEYPDIYCPVCGKEIVHSKERCGHILFGYEDANLDGVAFGYVHPRLKVAVKDLKEKYAHFMAVEQMDDCSPDAYDKSLEENFPTPSEVASQLNLDPNSTFILSVTNMFTSPGCSELVQTVVGIEFPPGSNELKGYKESVARHSQTQST